ncbi:MAG: DAK2 domain-containing protein, partial [Fidelibacterota bacterium]
MVTKINYLDGHRLHRALVAGIHKVVSRQEYLNKINVFPVPDGDTGTNMAFTLNAILEGTQSQVHSRVDQMLETVADSALDGARGNSGVILAQFFQGLCDGAADIDKMDTGNFSTAIEYGAKYAREALSEPKEGTILSVLTDFSHHLINLIHNGNNDFVTLIEDGIQKAEESLTNTMYQMEVLRKAGVVDAGAQGFVDLLNGIFDFISTGSIKDYNGQKYAKYPNLKIQSAGETVDLSYRFCTECMIRGENIQPKPIRKELMDLGNSLVFAGSKIKVKVHIHSNVPEKIFEICEKYGTVYGQKVDDMQRQQEMAHGKKADVAIITDSGADFPDYDELDVHMVPVRYSFGEKAYIDKVSMTPQEFYQKLENSPHHPQTSQPTPGDFRRQYQYIASHYNSIISIHLPHKLSGTWQSAVNASKRITEAPITVVDSGTVSIAQGLIVLAATEAANAGKSHDEILKIIDQAKSKTKLYAIIPDLSYAVKGGRVDPSKKRIANLLNITPILTLSENGSISTAGIRFGKKNLDSKIAKFVLKRIDKNKSYKILVAHGNDSHGGEKLLEILS